ncbi:MAG TPA: hypothetical protein VFE47_19085 [Tepidisphaeraceae bacterium]|nr:hypothetical protein [Tepidisphaeraceae bacterium]
MRQFLLAVQPIPMWPDDGKGGLNEAGPDEFFFYGAERSELKWQSLSDWVPESDWSAASGLAIGQSGYGDAFFWVKGHRVHPDGCIAIDDHEGDPQYYVLARSLPEFVGKVVRLKGLSPRALDDFDDDEGDEEDIADMFSTENLELFRAEHAELNPTLKRL